MLGPREPGMFWYERGEIEKCPQKLFSPREWSKNKHKNSRKAQVKRARQARQKWLEDQHVLNYQKELKQRSRRVKATRSSNTKSKFKMKNRVANASKVTNTHANEVKTDFVHSKEDWRQHGAKIFKLMETKKIRTETHCFSCTKQVLALVVNHA